MVIVPAALRQDQRLADMIGSNNVSESTVRRGRRDELTVLLAVERTPVERGFAHLM